MCMESIKQCVYGVQSKLQMLACKVFAKQEVCHHDIIMCIQRNLSDKVLVIFQHFLK